MQFYPVVVSLALAFGLALTAGGQPVVGSAENARGGRGASAAAGPTLATRLWSQADKNADGKLTSVEFAAFADNWFDALDSERIGRISQEEFLQRFENLFPPAAPGARGGRGVAAAASALGVFSIVDKNQDRALHREELRQAFDGWSSNWDADKDGSLNQDEFTTRFNQALPRTNMSGAAGRESQDPIPGLPTPPPSPILAPADAMKTIQLVEGFKLELAASEPMIEDPVALSFDEDGRAYVVEMRGYMLDIDRRGEREPVSRISRLEDTDGDGRFDKSSVFVDGLILPRAVAAVRDGILYVSDYMLYFAQDTNGDGKADRTELVDADYGRGNVEHAPNGLFRAMDNWIYNGESPHRYRLVGDMLVKQTTEQRGQWGMTQDNHGRLLYNVNNSQLLGDVAPPNYMGRNAHHPSSAGLNLFVSTDQRVFPIRMNTAVNRGYSPEVLSPAGRAYVFASSCSPVVYRGDNFPAEFVGNAFVCDPALNLIKRNLVSAGDLTLTSKFAYADREFLASTDERFRPSSLYNGPDGALWLVDLYHGVAQYSQFMTAYLRRETLARGLDKGVHHGRIYRIVSTAKKPAAFPKLSRETNAALVARLSDANGWTRDTAQRLLVERADRTIAPALVRIVERSADPLGRIHALWTLEGIFAGVPGASLPARTTTSAASAVPALVKVEPNFTLEATALPAEVLATCLRAIVDPNPHVQAAAIRVVESLTSGNLDNRRRLHAELARLPGQMNAAVVFQAALTAGNLPKPEALPLLARIATQAAEHLLVREAIVSGLEKFELQFLQTLLADPQWSQSKPGRPGLLAALASAIIKEREPEKIETLLSLAAGQSAERAWRRRSLLDGVAANTRVRPWRAIAFARAPTAFAALAATDDPAVRQQSEAIKTLFAWPGHGTDEAAKPAEGRALTAEETVRVAEGRTLFQQLCSACHGLAGQGVTPMGPPLVNSEWVLGPDSRLVRIVLQGMSGPIKVNDTVYQPPAILPEMPPLAAVDDNQLAAVLSFVRRAWGHDGAPISLTQIAAIRAETREQKRAWTEAQLLEIK